MTEQATIPEQAVPKKPKRVGPALPGTRYHRLRKTIHIVCFAVFVVLPLFNIMRCDIPRQRFYFFGAELWISEFASIFFSLMFLMFIVAAMAMVYGRLYCSYLCPQMIFSEAFISLENWIRRWVNKKAVAVSVKVRSVLAKALFWAILLVASVFLSFVFVSYFVEPRDLLRRLLSLDVSTAGGIAGATTTLLTFLDFAFLRLKFCTTVCPYGYLQGILADKDTLLVHYRDEKNACIKCNKCVRECPMGIDIRDSAHQIECTHCADCIDACSEILGKLGQPGLIHYAWGESGRTFQEERVWHRRLGIRDGKRVVVLLVLLFYASGLYVALAMRQPVLVRISPDRSTLYRIDSRGEIHNHFRVQVSNRGKDVSAVAVGLEGLDRGHIEGLSSGVNAKPGQTIQAEFDVVVAPSNVAPGVNPIRLTATTSPGGKRDEFPMTFIAPEKADTTGEDRNH